MEEIALFGLLISVAMVVIFIVMASNIGRIKKQVHDISLQMKRGYADAFREGEIKEIQGKKQEALDLYYESLYWFSKDMTSGKVLPANQNNKQKIEDKIRSLGGKAE